MGCGKSKIVDSKKHPDFMETPTQCGSQYTEQFEPISDPTVHGYDLDRSHCKLLIREYERRTDISQTLKDFVQVIRWWLDRYKYNDPDERTVVRISGDPNKNPFPVPGVLKDPLILRSWIYNTYLGEKLPAFDFNIDGDVAWNELPCDVIKEHITTDDQDRTIRQRERRTDLNDLDRMKKRHFLLLNYLRDKYKMGHSVVEQFSGFVDTVVQNNENFEWMCQESEQNYT